MELDKITDAADARKYVLAEAEGSFSHPNDAARDLAMSIHRLADPHGDAGWRSGKKRIGLARKIAYIAEQHHDIAAVHLPLVFFLLKHDLAEIGDQEVDRGVQLHLVGFVEHALELAPGSLTINDIKLHNNYLSFHIFVLDLSEDGDEDDGEGGVSARDEFEETVRQLIKQNHEFRERLATVLTTVLNACIQSMPHKTLEQKKELARWVNDQLEPLSIAVKCPNTGLPGKLRGVAGGVKDGKEDKEGSFCFEVRKNGRWTKTAYFDVLPVLKLIDSNPRQETEKDWRQEVGSEEDRNVKSASSLER